MLKELSQVSNGKAETSLHARGAPARTTIVFFCNPRPIERGRDKRSAAAEVVTGRPDHEARPCVERFAVHDDTARLYDSR